MHHFVAISIRQDFNYCGVKKLLHVQAAVIVDERMYNHSHNVLDVPLNRLLFGGDLKDASHVVPLGDLTDGLSELGIRQDHRAGPHFLLVCVRSAPIEALEKIELGLWVAGVLEYLEIQSRSAEEQLEGLVDLYLAFCLLLPNHALE
ncbi:Hypothetical protein BN69_0662 [Methylocystis sp. SC2]|nr:Hypothetical protein BN69_0662 [Methylocystis sp. SC2]